MVDLDVTAELRWFGSGNVLAAAADWFGVEPSPARIDQYLTAAAASGLGLKVRAGAALELKVRREEVGVWSLGERASGRAETWARWTLPLAPAWDQSALGDGWLRVEKRRRRRRFAVEPGPSGTWVPREVGEADGTELGCDAELTDLLVRGTSWWTLAFEAFGDADRQEDALRAVAGAVAASPPEELALTEAGSAAYPAWLAGLDPWPAAG